MEKRTIIGLTDLDDHNKKSHSRRVSDGMVRKWDKRRALKRLNARRQKPADERARYLKSRRSLKSRYRRTLGALAYREYGLVPHTGAGKRRREYELQINFLSLQYPKGRWDLEWEDWKSIWEHFPQEMRADYRLIRKDFKGPYSPENVQVDKLP